MVAPTRWASIDGYTSDARRAFIPSKRYQPLEDYVSFRPREGVETKLKRGYYHNETNEATVIRLLAFNERVSKVELLIADKKCCCGSRESIQNLEERREYLIKVSGVLRERRKAPRPFGATKTTQINNVDLYGSDGKWLYSSMLEIVNTARQTNTGGGDGGRIDVGDLGVDYGEDDDSGGSGGS
jgi:hypothetical protein